MVTSEISQPRVVAPELRSPVDSATFSVAVARLLNVLASLQLAVFLFSLSIFLVFVGTLAQVDHGVWDVVRNRYFHVWFAYVDWSVFEHLVNIFYPVHWQLKDGFYFPGGKLIGVALFINLLSAHAFRFKVSAKGKRLWGGIAVIALGLMVTLLAIRTGATDTVDSELAPVFCDMLWQGLRLVLAAVAVGAAYFLAINSSRLRRAEWWWLAAANALLGAFAIWLYLHPQTRLDDSDLRILWRLTKGLAAGGVLLAGCVMLFRKRAGIVLLHGGVALIMFSELLTAMTADEAQMRIAEGQTVNYADDIRTSELALIDHAATDHDQVTVVPQDLLAANVGADARLDHPDLPVTIRVLRWLPNSIIRAPLAGEPNPATAGIGLQDVAESARPESGIDKDAAVDAPAAYVELFSKENGKSLGVYLVFVAPAEAQLPPQQVTVGDRQYDLSLRFKRIYEPYSLTLKKFRFDRYVGTNTPKNYSSLVQLTDPSHNVDREVLIWMNNPLRYSGTTMYQSDFDHATEKATVLQIVRNSNWMMPYIGCMLVAVGMLAHFGGTLSRFLRRRADEAALARSPQRARQASGLRPAGASSTSLSAKLTRWFPAIIVAIFACYIAGKTQLPHSPPNDMQVYEFGKLPLAYQGRVKPYDTVARNALQILSGRQEVIGKDKSGMFAKLMGAKEKTPAITWLLDVISGVPAADKYQVFRIENGELLQTLGLEPRDGLRYSIDEIRDKLDEVGKQVDLANEQAEGQRSPYQNAVLRLADKLNLYGWLAQSFRPPDLSTERDKVAESLQAIQTLIAKMQASNVPHAVPPREFNGRWVPLMEAEMELIRNRVSNQPENPATVSLATMLDSYANGDATTFNKGLFDHREALADYERSLKAHADELRTSGVAKTEILSQPKINFEVFYNQFSPMYYAAVLYVVAFVLGALSWLLWTEPLRRASTWLICFTLALHTLALIGRIYISGRPPVTNLYSAAVFIGWGGVVLGLVCESLYGLGFGNLVASVIGFLTLIVAHFLSLDGDTFIVLQAVLDTQFWLATHVVCIALGNSTTFVAGFFGIVYILLAHVTNVLDDRQRRELMRMMYGTLCFAIFFSFVGTVLGGLWGDNSWGRFWGWDPKENGALLIVLYNALVLHARWGGMIGGRGLALLTIGGNIVTSWSLFGVNALGVGLHSYGFDRSTTMWLLTFDVAQVAMIIVGAVPQSWWRFREPAAA
jgi:ABC-type transport system involved in cytochrome c biogenesis permease subunit